MRCEAQPAAQVKEAPKFPYLIADWTTRAVSRLLIGVRRAHTVTFTRWRAPRHMHAPWLCSCPACPAATMATVAAPANPDALLSAPIVSPPAGVIELRHKFIPTDEAPADDFGGISFVVRRGEVDVSGLQARLSAATDAIWTPEGQQGNLPLRRAFHDKLGVGSVLLATSDDLLTKVLVLPWWTEWRALIEPVLRVLGIEEHQVRRGHAACIVMPACSASRGAALRADDSLLAGSHAARRIHPYPSRLWPLVHVLPSRSCPHFHQRPRGVQGAPTAGPVRQWWPVSTPAPPCRLGVTQEAWSAMPSPRATYWS